MPTPIWNWMGVPRLMLESNTFLFERSFPT